MGTSAIGIIDEGELDKIAQDVAYVIKREQCCICLWSGCECRRGSLLDTDDDKVCKAYTFYD